MKYKNVLVKFFLLVLVLVYISACGQKRINKQTITLSGAWAIYPTAVAWAEAYQKKNKSVKIDVSAGGAGKGVADTIAGLVDIGMVSREPDPSEIQKGIFPVYILHDAVFPIISEKNPAINDLLKKGVKRSQLIDIYINKNINMWDAIVGSEIKQSIHVYTRSDACGAASSWAKFLNNKKQEDLNGIGIYGDPGIIDTVSKDPLGIGYSNFSYVFSKNGSVLNGIKLLPIDSNENGTVDPEEIYNERNEAIKAIESGNYPATRKNYLFVKGKPTGLVKDFISFVLSEEGTKIVNDVGTSLPLKGDEREKILKTLE